MNVDRSNPVQSASSYSFRNTPHRKELIELKGIVELGKLSKLNKIDRRYKIDNAIESLIVKIEIIGKSKFDHSYINGLKRGEKDLPLKRPLNKNHKFKLIGNKKYFTSSCSKRYSVEADQISFQDSNPNLLLEQPRSKSSSRQAQISRYYDQRQTLHISSYNKSFQPNSVVQQQHLTPNSISIQNHGNCTLNEARSIKLEDISFINLANQTGSESLEKFILRTIFEEFAFFESLAHQENREVEITDNYILRTITRKAKNLPHTKYRFAGLFGSWLGRKGNYSLEFVTELSKHFDELNIIGERAFNYCKENHFKDKMQLIYDYFVNCASALSVHSGEIEKKYKGSEEISDYINTFKEKSDKFLNTANTLEKFLPQGEHFFRSFANKIKKINTISEYEDVIKNLKLSISDDYSCDVISVLSNKDLYTKFVAISCGEQEKKIYEQSSIDVSQSTLVSYNGKDLSTKMEIFSLLEEHLQLNSNQLKKISKVITLANHTELTRLVEMLLPYRQYYGKYFIFPNNKLLEIHAVCEENQIVIENHTLFDLQKVDQYGDRGEIIKKIKIIVKSTIPKVSLSSKNLRNDLRASIQYIFMDSEPVAAKNP